MLKSLSDRKSLSDHESRSDVGGILRKKNHSGAMKWWWKSCDNLGNVIIVHYKVEKVLLLDGPTRRKF